MSNGLSGAPSGGERRPLVLVSNRLPISVVRDDDGSLHAAPANGGLVTALSPVLERHGGTWVGWDGLTGELTEEQWARIESAAPGVSLVPVSLGEPDVEGFYDGFSNGTLWPLFHDFLDQATFSPDHWRAYLQANEAFAEAALEAAGPDHVIWVHDYHLLRVGRALRRREAVQPLIFFLHIPFPCPDVFSRLPWRRQVLEALTAYDLVGVQTRRDRENLLGCIKALMPEVGVQAAAHGATVSSGDHLTHVGAFPISIDWQEFDGQAREREVADRSWLLHEHYPERRIVLGVDRMDYSKGIPQRFAAYETFLERHPEFHEKVSLVQIAVPCRSDVPAYREFQRGLDEMVGNINGRFSRPGWVPIHYKRSPISRPEVLAYYRMAEVVLITSLKDGMNLVAKEYIAASVDEIGALVLSEFAGSAEELGPAGAFIVNPYDTEGVADTLRAVLETPAAILRSNLRRLRDQVRRHDVHDWADRILGTCRAHVPWLT